MLELLDWRRRIADLYHEVRSMEPERGWRHWRDTRDRMFGEHPESPIPQDKRSRFNGLSYFDYDPSARVAVKLAPATEEHFDVGSRDGTHGFTRFGTAEFILLDTQISLELYWLDGYAGGLFLPFRDATAGAVTYGAGRYLLDTAKGADLGDEDGGLVLDFNFAYHPSCAYDPKWACPLAPPANRISIPIEAGERL
ncbi:MAG: DUF1684 domain-containing protein [Actinobacteria bacterium]|nr:DUF1684 domain-containing protein [Actinomycetota bacterium]